MRPLIPINLSPGPVSFEVHPRLPNTLIVADQAASFQMINTSDTSRMSQFQVSNPIRFLIMLKAYGMDDTGGHR